MARYKKSSGYCINHPDREALKWRNYCQECFTARKKELRKQYNTNYRRSIASIGYPPKEELERLTFCNLPDCGGPVY